MTGAKIYCIIPGCRRGMFVETAVKRWGTANIGLICGRHWRRLTRRERAVVHRMRRKMKRFGDDAVNRQRWKRVWRALERRMADPRRIGREVGL